MNPAPPDPLTGLPLLPDDRRFIRQRLLLADDGRLATLLEGYRAHFLEGMAADPDPIKRNNSGRRAANTWLLEFTSRNRSHEQDFF